MIWSAILISQFGPLNRHIWWRVKIEYHDWRSFNDALLYELQNERIIFLISYHKFERSRKWFYLMLYNAMGLHERTLFLS